MTTHWVYGWHAALAILRQKPRLARRAMLSETLKTERRQEVMQLLTDMPRIVPEILPAAELDKRIPGVHQGIALLCQIEPEGNESQLYQLLEDEAQQPPFCIFLDRVQDPRNLGACMRVADAAGACALVMEKRNSAALSPVVLKTASGASVRLFRVPNMARCLVAVKKRGLLWVFGAAEDASQSLYETDLRGPLGLVLGSEGTGIRRLLRENCDALIRIPMQGQTPSLNLASAAAVCAFEALRQRQDQGDAKRA